MKQVLKSHINFLFFHAKTFAILILTTIIKNLNEYYLNKQETKDRQCHITKKSDKVRSGAIR
jgi:hypothetical protein